MITKIKKKKMIMIESTDYIENKFSIPLGFISLFNKIRRFIIINKCPLEVVKSAVKCDGELSIIPKEHSYGEWAVDRHREKDGLNGKRMKEIHIDTDKRKLILANNVGINKLYYIDEGKLGITGNHCYYILGENLELIQKILKFKLVYYIQELTKYRQNFFDREAFNYIPDLRKMGIDDIEEIEFYEMLGLKDTEINILFS